MEPIRVLQVFARMDRGGAESMIMNLYRNIDRTKIQFDFIVHTNDQCAYDDEIKTLGGCIYHLPRYSGKNHIQYKKAWRDFFEEHSNYKIIHGHVRSTASIYLKIARKYGLTTIAHSHSTSSGKGISAIAKNLLQYPIRYRADYLFACSKSAGEWLFGKKACEKDNFFVLNNAIDAKKFIFNKSIRKEKRKELGIQDKFVIGHVGRFDTAKNQGFLIDVFKGVHDSNKNAILLLVGAGELQDSHRKKVGDLGLSKDVIFTGVRSDIPEILQAMDLFVFPSLYEGLGMVVLEAQVSGLKCIVSNTLPSEVIISDLVDKISINKTAEYWANIIINYPVQYERSNMYNVNKEAGFDIEQSTKWLSNYYLGLHEK